MAPDEREQAKKFSRVSNIEMSAAPNEPLRESPSGRLRIAPGGAEDHRAHIGLTEIDSVTDLSAVSIAVKLPQRVRN